MKTIKKIDWKNLKHEYGVDGQRLLPWDDKHFPFPFGGAYCICKAHTSSLKHVNSPSDEQELFIVISGRANVIIGEETKEIEKGDIVYIPAGQLHYIENTNEEDFHFYALWWNRNMIENYTKNN